MSLFVLDASVTLAWCFEAEGSPTARSLLDTFETQEAAVPSIWPLEIANVLAISERSGRLTPADSSRFITLLGGLPITIDDQTSRRALGETLSLARTCQISSYDAAYLELALREGAALATFDEPLKKAASRAGVKLLLA